MNWFTDLFTGKPRMPPPAIATDADDPLKGKRLRYLIGADSVPIDLINQGPVDVIEVGYDVRTSRFPTDIKYCNLFDEKNTGKYGPYLTNSDTAKEYQEGQIDPRYKGWNKNLTEQFIRARAGGFHYIELDNPDAYKAKDVIGAIDLAMSYDLKVIAKNPGLWDAPDQLRDQVAYVGHRNVYGIIVEKGAGTAIAMNRLRCAARKPYLPVWFVFFGDGHPAALSLAMQIGDNGYRNMFVSYSTKGEYVNSIDI